MCLPMWGGSGGGGGGCPHPTSALGAVVHRPLVSVLVHDAIVDANAAVDTNSVFTGLVLIHLWKTSREHN